jgi:hypothetical protein
MGLNERVFCIRVKISTQFCDRHHRNFKMDYKMDDLSIGYVAEIFRVDRVGKKTVRG